MVFDISDVDKAVAEISDTINRAALGLENWRRVPDMVSHLFPGSFVGLQNFDRVHNDISLIEFVGVEPHHIQAYSEYYYQINPYERYWKWHKDGQIWVSDDVLPIELLRTEEFYNDWMSKIGDYDSAIGVKLNATAENEIRFNVQFPTHLFDVYAGPAQQILSRLRSPLRRATQLSHEISLKQIDLICSAALAHRTDKAACILDHTGQLKEANSAFEKLLRTKNLLNINHGIVSVYEISFVEVFSLKLKQASSSIGSNGTNLLIRGELGDWVISFSRLPSPFKFGLVNPLPLVLVLVTQLGQPDKKVELSEFSLAYELTSAEERLCNALAAGLSLTDAALRCNISYETARTRVKEIFRKTGMARQADLLLMIEQFRTG